MRRRAGVVRARDRGEQRVLLGESELLSKTMDSQIRVWGDVHGFVGDLNARMHVGPVEMIHSDDFHRSLNALRIVWDPKDWRDDLVMCGQMMVHV